MDPIPSTPGADPLRDLLTRVASGELDPADAARILDEDPTAPTLDHPEPTRGPVASVQIRAGGVKLVVVADPSVDTAVADGPHSVRHDGTALVIEAPHAEGYRVEPPPRFLGWVPTVWTGGRGERVTVRVNPRLPLTIDATACSVDVSGIHADLTLAGMSSSVKVRDHRGPVHGTVTMGSTTVVGDITGPSSLVCELGSVNLRLTGGSDVVLTASAELGSVKVAGAKPTSLHDGSARHVMTVGAGSNPFDVTVRMGSISVVAS
jgi:hypothetical protein